MIEAWLIDGCNLLHCFPSKNWYERLAGFASAKQCLVMVVLDGVGDDAEFEKVRTDFFHIVYAQNTSADCAIERHLFQNKGKASFTVVTNDRTILDMATGLGARVMKNNVFVEFLKETEHNTNNILWEQKLDSHGFHRPFDEKLKDLE